MVVLVAEGGWDERGAEGLLLLVFDGLEVWRRLVRVEIRRVDVRCEVKCLEWVCRWTRTSMVAESVWIDAALVNDTAEIVRIKSSERREVNIVAIMIGVAVKGVWEAWVREGGVCHFARHGGRWIGCVTRTPCYHQCAVEIRIRIVMYT